MQYKFFEREIPSHGATLKLNEGAAAGWQLT